jgi:hypothetical protein
MLWIGIVNTPTWIFTSLLQCVPWKVHAKIVDAALLTVLEGTATATGAEF